MIERLILVIFLAALAAGVFQMFRALHLRRIARLAGDGGYDNERTLPTLLYFHSDNCAACPTQGRVVEQVVEKWNGRLAIKRIDAEREPEQANRYGILSLPTTILIDSMGHIREINYGLTNAAKLERQLSTL